MALGGVISGSGGLAKIGAATLTLSGSNTFSGVTLVNSGTLALSNSLALQQSTFDCGSSGTAGLSFGALHRCNRRWPAGHERPQPAERLLDGGDAERGQQRPEHHLRRVLGGGGSLVKIGTGTLVLTAANTYGGTTTISAGTLRLAPAASPAASPAT